MTIKIPKFWMLSAKISKKEKKRTNIYYVSIHRKKRKKILENKKTKKQIKTI